MTTTKTIKRLEPDTTKQQEIDYLQEITDVPPNSYLAHVFTRDFVGYIINAILGSGMPPLDIMDALDAAEKLTRAKQTIILLKARLYDLTNKEEE